MRKGCFLTFYSAYEKNIQAAMYITSKEMTIYSFIKHLRTLIPPFCLNYKLESFPISLSFYIFLSLCPTIYPDILSSSQYYLVFPGLGKIPIQKTSSLPSTK